MPIHSKQITQEKKIKLFPLFFLYFIFHKIITSKEYRENLNHYVALSIHT